MTRIVLRHDQVFGDGTQLTIDAKHWNRFNLKERLVSVQLDLTYDVQWQLNAPKKNRGVGEGH